MPTRTGMRAGTFVKRLWKEASDDDLTGLAAQCAYAFIFALFPFLIFLVSLAAFLPSDTAGPQLPPELAAQMPAPVRDILEARIDEVAGADRGGTLTVALLVTIWSATAGATTLVTAINRAYDLTEKRSYVRRRLVGLALIAAGAVLLLLPSLWSSFGGIATDLLERAGLPDIARLVDALRWPVLLAGAFLWLALLFRVAPESSTRWRLATPGAFVAALGLLAANRGLSFYIESATDMSVTYGALGGFVALLLWLYVVSLVLLLGAEVNALLDSERRVEEPPPPVRAMPPERAAPPLAGRPVRT